MGNYFRWYCLRLNVGVALLHFYHRSGRNESGLIYFYLWRRLLLFVNWILDEIGMDSSWIGELSTLFVFWLVNIWVKFWGLELIKGLFHIIFGYLTVGVDFTPRDTAFFFLTDSPSLWHWWSTVLNAALLDWFYRLRIASHVWVWWVKTILFTLEGTFLKDFTWWKLRFYWSPGMFSWLEIASNCLKTLFIIVLVLFYRRNIIVGEIAALFLSDLRCLFDCDVLFFRLFCFLVFIENLIVHFDEIQCFVGYLQSFLILLYIFGYIIDFFPYSGFGLVLILL